MHSDQRRLIIFGTNTVSSVLHYYLNNDSKSPVVAFTVDAQYISSTTHEGLPVLAFEELESSYRPEEVHLLVPLGFRAINGLRRAKCEEAKSRGYSLAHYVSSRAMVWQGFEVRENSIFYEGAIIGPFSVVGKNVMIRSDVVISHHCTIGDHVFVAAGGFIGGEATVGDQAFIEIGATVRDGVTVGARCFIGAGAVVISNTEPDLVYFGNPASKIKGSSLNISNRR